MDDLDHLQEMEVSAAEARLAERLLRIQREAAIQPPVSRECDDCGCEIPAARLKVRPTARLCVDCQHDAERRLNGRR